MPNPVQAQHNQQRAAQPYIVDSQEARVYFNLDGQGGFVEISPIQSMTVQMGEVDFHEYVPVGGIMKLANVNSNYLPYTRKVPGCIRPGSLRVNGLGTWGGDHHDTGKIGVLQISSPAWGDMTVDAVISSLEREISAGDIIRISAEFTFLENV